MQSMFGGGAPTEDMFGKLEQMREIITEVNTQFKDPVGFVAEKSCAQADLRRRRPLLSVSVSQSSCRYTRRKD